MRKTKRPHIRPAIPPTTAPAIFVASGKFSIPHTKPAMPPPTNPSAAPPSTCRQHKHHTILKTCDQLSSNSVMSPPENKLSSGRIRFAEPSGKATIGANWSTSEGPEAVPNSPLRQGLRSPKACDSFASQRSKAYCLEMRSLDIAVLVFQAVMIFNGVSLRAFTWPGRYGIDPAHPLTFWLGSLVMTAVLLTVFRLANSKKDKSAED